MLLEFVPRTAGGSIGSSPKGEAAGACGGVSNSYSSSIPAFVVQPQPTRLVVQLLQPLLQQLLLPGNKRPNNDGWQPVVHSGGV